MELQIKKNQESFTETPFKIRISKSTSGRLKANRLENNSFHIKINILTLIIKKSQEILFTKVKNNFPND